MLNQAFNPEIFTSNNILTLILIEITPQVIHNFMYNQKFYHGFVMGLLINLKGTHEIKSNRESGYGRYDVLIIPHDKNKLGIIIEFKTVEQTEDLEEVN